MSLISTSINPYRLLPAHDYVKHPHAGVPNLDVVVKVKEWCKAQDWGKALLTLNPKPLPSNTRYHTATIDIPDGEGTSQLYPYVFDKDDPTRVYEFDDNNKRIYLKCACLILRAPFFIIENTVKNLYKGTIGNVVKAFKQMHSPSILPPKKIRWMRPWVNIVRCPLYVVTMAVIAASALVLSPLKPSSLFTFRKVIGDIDLNYRRGKSNVHKNFATCFQSTELRKIVETCIQKIQVGKFEFGLPEDDEFQLTLDEKMKPEDMLHIALYGLGFQHIRYSMSMREDISSAPLYMWPIEMAFYLLFKPISEDVYQSPLLQ